MHYELYRKEKDISGIFKVSDEGNKKFYIKRFK